MSASFTYYMATSGRPKELLEEWRQQFKRSYIDFMDWGRELGAKRVFRDYDGIPIGFSFARNSVPEGWTKMTHSGFSRPKKNNHAAQARMEALNLPLNVEEYVQEHFNLPHALFYQKDGVKHTKGLSPVGKLTTFEFIWTMLEDGSDGNVIMRAPDYKAEAENLGDVEWLPEGSIPDIPEGFVQMSRAEVDLHFAQSAVRHEKYISKCQDMITLLNVAGAEELYNGLRDVLSLEGYVLLVEAQHTDRGVSCKVAYEDDPKTVHAPLHAAAAKLVTMLIEQDLEQAGPGTIAKIRFTDEGLPMVNYHTADGAVEQVPLKLDRLKDVDLDADEPGVDM